MKRLVTSFFLFIFCLSFFNLTALKVAAQTVNLYTQSFDSTTLPVLPAGWSTNGWTVDTSKKNLSTGYSGASGLNNVVVSNATGVNGPYELVSNSISTTDYVNLTVEWATRNTKHFADSGSTVTGISWSSDNGGTWNPLNYTENLGNSTWALDNNAMAIPLPAGAEHQASLKFKWVVNLVSNFQGTYRIDDFNVTGTFSQANGIKSVNAGRGLGNVFIQNNNINIYSAGAANEKVSVEVFNVLGNVVKSTIMNSSKLILNTGGLSSGVYFVRLSAAGSSTVNKVVLN